MELHQLRYFEATARLGSMMAAAAECRVSQPALSVQIRKLEEEAGAPLLLREARGVRLTAAGERTLMMAKRVLNESRGWAGDMRAGNYAGEQASPVAVQPLLATELLPGPLATLLRRDGGRVRLCFRERAAPVIAGLLRNGDVDSALVDVSAHPAAGLVTEPVLRVPYALFTPPGHALAGAAGPVSLTASVAGDLLHYAAAPGLGAHLRAVMRRGGVGREPAFSGEHAAAIFELVAAGAGVAVLPELFARRAATRGVARVRLEDYRATLDVALVRRPDAVVSAPLRELLGMIRSEHPRWAAAVPDPAA